MVEKDYISIMILFILCLIGGALKAWDYFLVRRAINKEREDTETVPGRIVIRAEWRSWFSTGLLFVGLLVPLVTGAVVHAVPLALFILFAVAAAYYFLHSLLWRIVLDAETFTCRAISGKETVYRYADVRRIVPLGRKKKKMDGMRILMQDGAVIFVDRTLYGLETLERRVRAVRGGDFVADDLLSPMRPLR